MRHLTALLLAGLLIPFVQADDKKPDPYGPLDDFKFLKPEDKQHTDSVPPPEGAVVLFDGKSFDGWVRRNGGGKPTWKLADGGAMQVGGGGDLITEKKFDGHFHLHVEFRVPYMPNAKGQGRGNSGVYVQGRYEVQVLDSYGLDSQDNDCGGIYKVAKPKVNACKAPTVWQTYDIDFTSPVCEDGKKKIAPRISVKHNGVVIHDNVEITVDNTVSGAGGDVCTPGPVLLQDHGNPVQYRNIWLKMVK